MIHLYDFIIKNEREKIVCKIQLNSNISLKKIISMINIYIYIYIKVKCMYYINVISTIKNHIKKEKYCLMKV